MKIAIYGDSFAHSRNNLDTSWYTVLGRKLNCTVDTYGCSGSPVYYSYKQFMDTNDRYDRVIFLVTEPSRYHSKIHFTSGDSLYIGGINAIEWFRENAGLNATDLELLNNLEIWYKASDLNYASDMTELMLEKVESTRNVIFLPCFHTSFSEKWMLKEPNAIPLIDLVIRQTNILCSKSGLNFDLFSRENHNVISAHLTPEFNEFVADVMYDRIMTGKWDFSELDNVKLLHKQDYYYRID